MKVDVSSSSPILRMEVLVDDFGKLFASMTDKEQVEVFRSMIRHMSDHAMQWDYVQIELEKPENEALARHFREVFTPQPTT